MITCLCDETKWGRHCDIVLGYYWPSDDLSERRPPASGNPGSSSHDDVNGWMSEADTSMVVENLVFLDHTDPG